MGVIDYFVIAVVAAAVIAALISIIRSKKNGQGCSGDCAHCKRNCGK